MNYRQSLKASEMRHIHVEQDQVNEVHLNQFDRLTAIGSKYCPEALLFEDFAKTFPNTAIIISYKDCEAEFPFFCFALFRAFFCGHIQHLPAATRYRFWGA